MRIKNNIKNTLLNKINFRNKESKKNLLYYNFIIYILNDFITKKEIFRINYNNFNIKYFARKRIKKNIKFKYY